jgi:LPLT family lysophospholipid transporter-like MFS transporter
VTLVRNPDTRFSMTGTSLFWAAGSTLRFLLVAWVPVALGLTDNSTPAYLNAVVAVGIVIGAGLAGKYVTLDKAERALPAGVLIGLAGVRRGVGALDRHLVAAPTLANALGGERFLSFPEVLRHAAHRIRRSPAT